MDFNQQETAAIKAHVDQKFTKGCPRCDSNVCIIVPYLTFIKRTGLSNEGWATVLAHCEHCGYMDVISAASIEGLDLDRHRPGNAKD